MLIQAPRGIKDPSELYLADKAIFIEAFKGLLANSRPVSVLKSQELSAESQRLWNEIKFLAENTDLIKLLTKAVADTGYAGDVRPALCAFIAITSRLLDKPLNLVFLAQSGSGKNASIEAVLPFFPQQAVYIIRASSPMALVYSDVEFSHRTVIVWEADSLPEDGSAASAVRSLISDQRLEYEVVEKDESGHFKVRRISKPGPTGIITTTTKPLGEQASTRMLTVSIPDSTEQTKAVLRAIAKKAYSDSAPKDFKNWIAFQTWLEIAGEHLVVVPLPSHWPTWSPRKQSGYAGISVNSLQLSRPLLFSSRHSVIGTKQAE